jgi:chitin synthase
MDPSVVSLFQTNAGQDITKRLDSLGIDGDTLARQKVCLRNLFTIGKVDNRNSPACTFSTYILLALSVFMVSIIGFKFIASINLSGSRAPENHDKFVICQIPCYTEGEQSIKRTVDSLAMTKYDDKRKLIVVICDGMVIGAGNDKSTPGIVLSVLGHDPAQEPEALSFISLGDGSKQHNMGKVYSGLYEVSGHVVPYLVLCKVGKPSERTKPGNRGKRDTQMLVMSFLNKVCGFRAGQSSLLTCSQVHFAAPMNPFELEVYHQIKNVIGVNPTFYEYILTVDADTTVAPLSLNRLISAYVPFPRGIYSSAD